MTAAPPSAARPALLWVAVSFVVAVLAWNTAVFYPLKLLVVFMHESGHALAAIGTGGKVESIEIDAHEAGVTRTRGGWSFVVLSGGYLGSTVLGALVLWASWTRQLGRHVLRAMGALMGVAVLFVVRDLFTAGFCLAVGAALLAAGWLAPAAAQRAIGTFLGVTSCLYAVIDIKDDILTFHRGDLHFMAGVGKSDAQALADLTLIPAPVWGVLWIAISLVVIFQVLRVIAKAPPSGVSLASW